jgi:serine protease SohB
VQLLTHYGLFLLETVTIVLAIIMVLFSIVAIAAKGKLKTKGQLHIESLNSDLQQVREQLQHTILNKKQLKTVAKQNKKLLKQQQKQQRKRIFVLDFNGDIKASQAENLRQEITAILSIATKKDEVLARLESPGGVVHGYGLAASQLQRLRDHHIPLTIAVDKVAASGGYMMACVADKLIAAPFAIIGSIGVVFQLPNFHKLLQKNNIDVEQVTAGQYKRTLTIFGENTQADREKVQQELDETHELFKEFITQHRPQVNMQQVGTGEYWFGLRAKQLNLVDDIQTSDEYLMQACQNHDIYRIKYAIKKSFGKRLAHGIQQSITELTSHF